MSENQSVRTGYFKGASQEMELRYAYRPEFVPLLIQYLGVKPGMHILEAGCGSGFLSRLIVRTVADVKLVALDTDGEMLSVARRLQEQEGLHGHIQLGYGDAFHLPFPDDCFDHVTSQRLL